jgi:hypothetical protein
MPFDVTVPDRLPQDVQNLRKLADALEREHESFTWNFGIVYDENECGTVGCAIGMAIHIGMFPGAEKDLWFSELDRSVEFAFDLSEDELRAVFGIDAHIRYRKPSVDITPRDVARELRRIADEKVARAISKRTAEVETQDV